MSVIFFIPDKQYIYRKASETCSTALAETNETAGECKVFGMKQVQSKQIVFARAPILLTQNLSKEIFRNRDEYK